MDVKYCPEEEQREGKFCQHKEAAEFAAMSSFSVSCKTAAGSPAVAPYACGELQILRDRRSFMIQSLKNPQFRVVYDRGKSRSDRYLVMYVYPNGLSINRLGITVSKRNGNSVVRSRLKRIIKEAYRQQQHRFLSGYDIVFIARNPAKDQKSTQLERSILGIAEKFQILKTENRVGD